MLLALVDTRRRRSRSASAVLGRSDKSVADLVAGAMASARVVEMVLRWLVELLDLPWVLGDSVLCCSNRCGLEIGGLARACACCVDELSVRA